MKFFILGDSWGCGEYSKLSKNLLPIPNTGVDYYLRNLGHTVTNEARGGSSNFGQLRHAYWTLKENSDYDYIIWFHTEPLRDIVNTVIDDAVDGPIQYPNFKNIKEYDQALTYINDRNYQYAQDTIYTEFGIPFIVIGGPGRLEDCIDNYTFARHKIYSWIEKLLNLDYRLPRNQMDWHRCPEVFSTFNYKNRLPILQELQEVDDLQKLLIKSPLFPDNSHPSRDCSKKLAQQLIEMILK